MTENEISNKIIGGQLKYINHLDRVYLKAHTKNVYFTSFKNPGFQLKKRNRCL